MLSLNIFKDIILKIKKIVLLFFSISSLDIGNRILKGEKQIELIMK